MKIKLKILKIEDDVKIDLLVECAKGFFFNGRLSFHDEDAKDF